MMKRKEPLFPSDLDLARNPRLGELRFPEAVPSKKVNLFTRTTPYYEGGFKILIPTPEFRLIRDFSPEGPKRVEWSYDLRRRFLKSAMRINASSSKGSDNWTERVLLAQAMDSLLSFYRSNAESLAMIHDPLHEHPDDAFRATPHGGLGCARLLGATLGLEIERMLTSDDPAQSARDLTAALGNALNAVNRLHGKTQYDGSFERPQPHDAIQAAAYIFETEEARPTKRKIRFLLEKAYNLQIEGKNKQQAWSDLFNVAGLGNLKRAG